MFKSKGQFVKYDPEDAKNAFFGYSERRSSGAMFRSTKEAYEYIAYLRIACGEKGEYLNEMKPFFNDALERVEPYFTGYGQDLESIVDLSDLDRASRDLRNTAVYLEGGPGMATDLNGYLEVFNKFNLIRTQDFYNDVNTALLHKIDKYENLSVMNTLSMDALNAISDSRNPDVANYAGTRHYELSLYQHKLTEKIMEDIYKFDTEGEVPYKYWRDEVKDRLLDHDYYEYRDQRVNNEGSSLEPASLFYTEEEKATVLNFSKRKVPSKSDKEMEVIRFLKESYAVKKEPYASIIRPRVVCKDGSSFSVQASEDHLCFPKESLKDGKYESVELMLNGRPRESLKEHLSEYDTLGFVSYYGLVPVEKVEAFITERGGIDFDKTFAKSKTSKNFKYNDIEDFKEEEKSDDMDFEF